MRPLLALTLLGCAGLGCAGLGSPAASDTPPAGGPSANTSGTDNHPSFDCAKADTPNQRRICASADLSALDRDLAAAWKAATAAPGEKERLLPGQKEWLAGNGTCADDACLAARYHERIGFLKGVAAAPAASGAASVTGHWSGDHGGIDLLESPPGTLRFGLSVTGGGSAEYGPNLGSASGTMPRVGDTATYTFRDYGDPCTFRFAFHGETLTLEQDGTDGDCGFGMGVYAGGTYTRRDTIAPTAAELSAGL